MSKKIEVVTRKVTGVKKLRCVCGEPVIVTDDSGSLGCSVDCGWEGLKVELAHMLVPGDSIEWVGDE